MNTPKNAPESNRPSPTPVESMKRTHHTPAQPFVPSTQPAPASQKQSSENFSGHTPAQSFTPTKPVSQQTQSNIVRGIDKTVFGDAVQGSHHTPRQQFSPSTPSKPAAPTPAPQIGRAHV